MSAFRIIIALLSVTGASVAHNPDTSYVRTRIFSDLIELRLTFDAFTLAKIVPTLDANGDRALTKAELRAAAPAVQAWLRTHVGMEVNGAATDLGVAGEPFWPLNAPDALPAEAWHNNEALISFPFDKVPAAPPKTIALLFDVFEPLKARHTVLGNFDIAGRSHQAIFTSAQPDYVFDITSTGSTPQPAGPRETKPAASTDMPTGPAHPPGAERRSNTNTSPLPAFLWQGVLHIWIGFDHICFLLALLVASRFRALIGIVTAFTVAHSITLILAARGIIALPPKLIECAIAATIVYVAVENLIRLRAGSEPRHRWMLTFVFGLIHGFGFANVLGELELPQDSFVSCLLMFNVGVELGQLAIVLTALPLLALAAHLGKKRGVAIALSLATAVLGAAWLVDRVFALEMMPF